MEAGYETPVWACWWPQAGYEPTPGLHTDRLARDACMQRIAAQFLSQKIVSLYSSHLLLKTWHVLSLGTSEIT